MVAVALLDQQCVNRIATGAAVGGALGASIGALYGTYEAFRYKVPGLYKIRYIGQTTVSSAAVFGLFWVQGVCCIVEDTVKIHCLQ